MERNKKNSLCMYVYFNNIAAMEKLTLWAIFPDVVTQLSKLLDPAHVTPRVKLCIHTKF